MESAHPGESRPSSSLSSHTEDFVDVNHRSKDVALLGNGLDHQGAPDSLSQAGSSHSHQSPESIMSETIARSGLKERQNTETINMIVVPKTEGIPFFSFDLYFY